MRTRPFAAVTAIVFVLSAVPLLAQIDARMLRYPDVSTDRIAFVYAGDVWIVATDSGRRRFR
jgi:tricorn protease